jgi:hypothetical protein
MAKNDTSPRDRVVRGLIFRFQGTSGHARQSRGRTQLDETFEAELSKEEILSLDPTDGGGKLVGEEFDEDDVGELLTVLGVLPVILLPLLEDFVETRGSSLVVDYLTIFARNVEGLGDQVGDVLANEHFGVEMSGVDLL